MKRSTSAPIVGREVFYLNSVLRQNEIAEVTRWTVDVVAHEDMIVAAGKCHQYRLDGVESGMTQAAGIAAFQPGQFPFELELHGRAEGAVQLAVIRFLIRL